VDSDGVKVKEFPSQCKRVMSMGTADAVNDILRGVQETGFGAQAGINLTQPSAGKTGTINDNKAVWFVGYTPTLATASMIAGANSLGQPITLNGQTLADRYVISAHGSTTAGPMWGDAMKKISAWLPDDDFVAPDSDTVSGVQVSVPSTNGMSTSAAEDELRSAGFYPSVSGSVASGSPAGTVAYTSPGGGSYAAKGSSVTIYPSTGHPPRGHGGRGNGGRGNGGRGGGR
jgi:membrane carboxypeptidase/penicillin-binding protein